MRRFYPPSSMLPTRTERGQGRYGDRAGLQPISGFAGHGSEMPGRGRRQLCRSTSLHANCPTVAMSFNSKKSAWGSCWSVSRRLAHPVESAQTLRTGILSIRLTRAGCRTTRCKSQESNHIGRSGRRINAVDGTEFSSKKQSRDATPWSTIPLVQRTVDQFNRGPPLRGSAAMQVDPNGNVRGSSSVNH
jgi:hypothetical protein